MERAVERAYSASEIIAQEEAMERAAASAATARCSYARATPAAAVAQILGTTGPVFSCRTCAATAGRPVGVCEACTLNCHVEHDVVEVGSRNHHRCDCPTLDGHECACAPAGAPTSGAPSAASNMYGHNFDDRFCACDRAYDASADTMHQCVACNEWFHDHHIFGMIPGGVVDIEALVCTRCVAALPFLRTFARFTPGACANVVGGVAPGAGLGGACVPEPPANASVSAQTPAAGPTAAGAAGAPPTPASDASSAAAAASDASPSTRAGSPTAAAADAAYNFEPWVCCLTCTAGADDGVSVCLGCAAACHAGHVLTPPRLSDFASDCSMLGGGCRIGGGGGSGGGGQRAADASAAPAADRGGDRRKYQEAALPLPLPTPVESGTATVAAGGKRVRDDDAAASDAAEPSGKKAAVDLAVLAVGDSAVSSPTPRAPLPLAASPPAPLPPPPTKWCAAAPDTHALPLGFVAVGGRDGPPPMLLGALDSLTSRLCRCGACMDTYMRARVGTWFWGDAEDTVADDCVGVARGTAADGAAGVDADGGGQAFRTSYDRGLEALSAMPTTMQVDMLRGYRACWTRC
jgi:hypothetical protein